MPSAASKAYEVMWDVLPESGDTDYTTFYPKVMASSRQAIGMFHSMRRAGHVIARLEKAKTGGLILFVSRGKDWR